MKEYMDALYNVVEAIKKAVKEGKKGGREAKVVIIDIVGELSEIEETREVEITIAQ